MGFYFSIRLACSINKLHTFVCFVDTKNSNKETDAHQGANDACRYYVRTRMNCKYFHILQKYLQKLQMPTTMPGKFSVSDELQLNNRRFLKQIFSENYFLYK